jgi:hypothetical protein
MEIRKMRSVGMWGTAFCFGVALFATGCGSDKRADTWSSIPVMPMPMSGEALLAGQVRDADGHGVAGAKVVVAETDGVATSDGDGRYVLKVPSDSTITLVTSAAGYAKTYHESVVLAAQAMVDGVDVMLLSADRVTAMNTFGAPAAPAGSGLMAIRLQSMSPTCLTAGAHISVWPPKAATVVYSRASATGGLDEPDPTVGAVQTDVRIAAWLTGTVPPGNMLTISVDQPGCQMMIRSPSMNGLVFPGQRRVDAQALTEAYLFLN